MGTFFDGSGGDCKTGWGDDATNDQRSQCCPAFDFFGFFLFFLPCFFFSLSQPSKDTKKGNRGERENKGGCERKRGRYTKATRAERERIVEREREKGSESKKNRERYCKAMQGVDVSVSQACGRGSDAVSADVIPTRSESLV